MKIHLVKAALTWCHVQKKNAMFQPSITAKNKHNGATVYIYIYSLYLFWACHRETGPDIIGCHRIASGGTVYVRIGHRMASGRHREGSRRTLKQREFEDPTRSDVGKASGRHREIMVEHCCIGKCCFHFVPLFILQQSGEKITGTWLVVGLCAMASWLQKVNHLRLSWHAVM